MVRVRDEESPPWKRSEIKLKVLILYDYCAKKRSIGKNCIFKKLLSGKLRLW